MNAPNDRPNSRAGRPRRGARLLPVIAALVLLARPALATTTTFVSSGDDWKYFDLGTDQGAAWRQPGFDDSAWSAGPSQLGYGDGDEATVVGYGPSSSTKYVTTWFRRSFVASGVAALTRLELRLVRDDGAVVYLNGTEVARSNMPAGTVSFSTTASSAIAGAAESAWQTFPLSPALLLEGTNVLAVEMHQSSGSSSDLSFDLQLVGSDASVFVTRGPYLQSGTPEAVTVRWRTDVATDSRVRWGSAPGSLDQVADDPTTTTEHSVRITGLSPATTYFYSIGSTTNPLDGDDAATRFTTPPAVGTAQATRVWVLGDSGTASAGARAVRDAFDGFTGARATDLWLMLGDNAYDSGTDLEYQAGVFDTYPDHLRRAVLWPTIGNHDAASADSATQSGPYYDIFELPTAGEAGGVASGTEAYYSFDWANVHFVCLDSQESSRLPGSPMLTWLADDLQATDQRWVVAFWHHPPYSKGSHDSDTESQLVQMRTNVLPILEAHGVDLVLTGHSHSYERSVLLDGHYGLSTTLAAGMIVDPGDGDPAGDGAYAKEGAGALPHGGAVYAVAGSSGQASGGRLDHPVMQVSLNALGSLVLDVDGEVLDARFLDSSGLVRDRFSIVKTVPTPTPVPTATPLPTSTPTPPTPTGTPAVYDLMVDVPKPVRMTIRGGEAEAVKVVRLRLRNLDPAFWNPNRATLVAHSDDCPGLVDGTPDFGSSADGIRNRVILEPGHSATASLRLVARAAEHDSPTATVPTRCTVSIEGSTTLSNAGDVSWKNAKAVFDVDVLDRNDPPLASRHESWVAVQKPMRLVLRPGIDSLSKTLRLRVGNADPSAPSDASGHAIVPGVDPGDCPAGSISVDPTPLVVPAGRQATVPVTVTVNPVDFGSWYRTGPSRCTFSLRVSTGVPGNVEPDPSNDAAHVVLDVYD